MSGADATATDATMTIAKRGELLLSLALLGVLVVLLIPLPPVLLDLLLALNLSVTILLLLITLGVKQPLDISVFPSLLLLLTLYRLSLNVATTRLILLDGDAGRIISTFGNFVVGGNLVVGLVIFSILVVIQFIVITRGASRVSEVAARFTLDALPGKQMAIDAELGAGTIDESEARQRRQDLAREAEFYGAMDGASRFTRGDAIAGLVITIINPCLVGVILGLSAGLSFSEAIRRFSILTVGDGLVSQIPGADYCHDRWHSRHQGGIQSHAGPGNRIAVAGESAAAVDWRRNSGGGCAHPGTAEESRFCSFLAVCCSSCVAIDSNKRAQLPPIGSPSRRRVRARSSSSMTSCSPTAPASRLARA